MRTLILVLVFIAPPPLKRYILEWFSKARVGKGVRIGWFSAVVGRRIELGDYSEIRALSLIRCDGDVELGAYSIVSNMVLAYGSASLRVGPHCYIGPQCLINADEDVLLGRRSALGPRCQLFTHGSFLPFTEGYWAKYGGIRIGDRVWIASGVFIQPGVVVGDHAFVNARSVLSQHVASGEVVQGPPSVPVARIEDLKRKMTPKRVDRAVRHMLERFAEIVLRRGRGIEVEQAEGGDLLFGYRGRRYRVLLVPSEPMAPPAGDPDSEERWIVVVNRPGWKPPAGAGGVRVFALDKMTAATPDDPIQEDLWSFLRRYFGVTFELE